MLQKVLEADPATMLIQLDVKQGNVNEIVNESVRSTYQVRLLYLSFNCPCSHVCVCQPGMASQYAVVPNVLETESVAADTALFD